MPHVQNLGLFILEEKQESMLCIILIPKTPLSKIFSMNASEYRNRNFPEASHSLVTW